VTLNDYDQEYSEVEDLIGGDNDADSITSLEEKSLTYMLRTYGTLALVLYHRIKKCNYLREYVSNPIFRIMDSYDLLIGDSISDFIKEMLQLILDSMRIINEKH
jgi:hypothetical protein